MSIRPSTRGLEFEPPTSLFVQAQRQQPRAWGSFVEHRPLSGVAETLPLKFLRALALSQKRGERVAQYWAIFLGAAPQRNDSVARVAQIARRLARLPFTDLSEIIDSVSTWISQNAGILQNKAPLAFADLWPTLMAVLNYVAGRMVSTFVIAEPIDWANHSLDSPAGKLADSLMKDDGRRTGDRGLSPAWLARVEDLLRLPGDGRRDALVMTSFQLNWFYHNELEWTERHILSSLASMNPEDVRAFWAGFYWRAQAREPLFIRLKRDFLALLNSGCGEVDHEESIVHLVLAGWVRFQEPGNIRVITDLEMHDALIQCSDRVRVQVIRELRDWLQAPDTFRAEQSLRLLRDVWPKQLSVRSPDTTFAMLDFTVDNAHRFAEAVNAVIPFLVKLSPGTWVFHRLFVDVDGGLSRFEPNALLRLLEAVLADRAVDWPHGADRLVEHLAGLPELTGDSRMAKLRIRLAAR